MTPFNELGVKSKNLTGLKIEKTEVFDKQITVLDYRVKESLFNKKHEENQCLHLQLVLNGETRVLFIGSSVLIDQIQQIPPDKFPFTTTIIKELNWYKFT